MHSVSLTLSLIIAQRAFYATLNTHQYPHWWPFNVAHHIEHHQDFKLVTCPISGGPFGWTRKLPDSVIPANFRNNHTAQSGARQSASEEAPRWCHIHPHQGKAGLLVCSHFTARPILDTALHLHCFFTGQHTLSFQFHTLAGRSLTTLAACYIAHLRSPLAPPTKRLRT